MRDEYENTLNFIKNEFNLLTKNSYPKKITTYYGRGKLVRDKFKIDTDYYGLYEKDGTGVKYVKGDRDGLYDFCSNIFIAKTASLLKYKWDEELKLGEHFAYFYEHQGKLKIGVSDVPIDHCHFGGKEYSEYRNRAVGYVKQYMKKKGITHIKDLSGGLHPASL